jgi:hypothetical protein
MSFWNLRSDSSGNIRCSALYGIVVLVTLVATRYACAQEAPIDTNTRDSYLEAINQMRKGLKLNSQEVERIDALEEKVRKKTSSEGDLFTDYYFIEGNEGIPFPDPTALAKDEIELETPTPIPTTTPIPTATPWTKPKRCTRADRETFEHHALGDSNQILYDMIFISHDLVPMDSVEVYGRSAKIIPYSLNKDDGAMIRMRLYKVPCVPYRIRMTGKDYFYESGLNALRNYDTAPSGKGKLHPWVSQKLYGDTNKTKQQRKRFRKR